MSTNYEYAADPEYEKWLVRLANECKCAPCCNDVPCGGLQQGGFCDTFVCRCGTCSGYDGEDDDNDWQGDDW
jgi:hypothetical protein